MDFTAWPKMGRLDAVEVIVTEKIDGTNAQIAIDDQGNLDAGSRNRWLSHLHDNYGFYATVSMWREELVRLLPPGRHYGEWAGPGIQKNPLKLKQRTFFCFNHWLFTPGFVAEIQKEVPWFDVVPVWYRASLAGDDLNIEQFVDLAGQGERPFNAREFDGPPEGFVVQIGGDRFKWTPRGAKWKGQDA